MEIIFTDTIGVDPEFAPTSASSNLPEWYVKSKSYVHDKKEAENSMTTATIKRCMPVFDLIVNGYLIYSYVDVFITQPNQIYKGKLKKVPMYQWPSYDPIHFHAEEQFIDHFKNPGYAIPKWVNAWGIKTPPGYSCIFSHPKQRDLPFTIFEGIVDTDKYVSPVNFPFTLNDPDFEGLIPAGTPIAQVTPFKRESWKMSLGSDKDRVDALQNSASLKTRFFDSYKTRFRQVKEYK